jgi:transcriptional regulator GlxA family with amidase domain
MSAPLVQSILSGLLLTADHDLRALLDRGSPRIGPTAVRRAHTYIEQHADQALTVTQVAAQVGVSVRALQQAFQRSLNITPNQLIRHIRLTRAHADLLAADPAETQVSDIAARWGFAHPGRFATYYSARYAVHPSDTLRGRG